MFSFLLLFGNFCQDLGIFVRFSTLDLVDLVVFFPFGLVNNK